jgi:hypothetical protein
MYFNGISRGSSIYFLNYLRTTTTTTELIHTSQALSTSNKTHSRLCILHKHYPPQTRLVAKRGLLPLWSQVWVLWLLIWWSLEAYMVVKFRVCGISRGARKLIWTLMLIKKRKTRSQAIYITLSLFAMQLINFLYLHEQINCYIIWRARKS